MGKASLLFLLLSGCVSFITCMPQLGNFVAVGGIPKAGPISKDADSSKNTLVIEEMYIRSDVKNRFANTVITSKVRNTGTVAKEATFWAILPEGAYIAGFKMEIGGKNYTAYVEEKDKAQKTYDNAVASGIGAAHVALNARDSNKFTVNMNIEPNSFAIFHLTYEELLKRSDEKYELVININPKQVVNKMTVEVVIVEGVKLTKVETPQMRTGNAIVAESEDLDPRATISRPSEYEAVVLFMPDALKQKKIAEGLGKTADEGISGQFVVVYDVERELDGGEYIVNDGYFVHYFAPETTDELKKHVVFVLDTSGSMYGSRIQQLKESITKILSDAQTGDFFNVVEFNTNVKVHNLDAPSESAVFYSGHNYNILEEMSYPPAYPVNEDTKAKANALVNRMQATDMTNIYDALKVALHLVKLRRNRVANANIQPIVFFLTDGDPTQGLTNTEEIIRRITQENEAQVPIISLSFGQGVNRNFLEKLSLLNYGFARHIYEDSDSSLQLQRFYKEVSSVIYRNIQFKYVADETSLTITKFPTFFRGSEFVIAGKLINGGSNELPIIECIGPIGPIILRPKRITKNVSRIERLWAYMTIKKLLDEKKTDETKAAELDKKALDLAMKYHFVTPYTSLVVVKPNSTSAVNTAKADDQGDYYEDSSFFAPNGALASPQFLGKASAAALPAISGGALSSSIGGFAGAGLLGAPGGAVGGLLGGVASWGGVVDPFDYDPIDFDPPLSTPRVPVPVVSTKQGVLPKEYKPFLQWIEKYLRDDDSLTIFQGFLTLGYNATSPANQLCTTTASEMGSCKLVKDCPKLHSSLTAQRALKDHMCNIESKYVGVCCPK